MATEPAEAAAAEEKPEEKLEEKVEESKNPLDMSDEEFLKLNGPPPTQEKEKEEKPVEAEKAEKAENDSKPEDEPAKESKESGDEPAKETKAEPEKKEAEPGDLKAGTEDLTDADKAKEKKPKAETENKPVDYERFFKQIMTPFKANGKTIEVRTPEEAIRLMQMGAGYGRKIQDMQPHLKVLRMLEKNDLLDEGKLSYLIDLNQKKPDAIKKLIKDGGIDPLDLNTDDKVTYTPTNHGVTDKEVVFHQTLAEIQAQPGGSETLRIINQTWDQESKALLWESPEIFQVIQTQRENGVYHQIANEIDRQKLLGTITNTTPFLQAYKVAGDHLVKTNGFKSTVQKQPGNGTQQPQVIATRTATPKSQASNSDKAAAASPTKTTPVSKPNLTVNPLEMSDDDFMKQFKGRF